jgi:hypothetical protein
MRKIDIKDMLDKNKIEFEVNVQKLLRIKNELEGKKEEIKVLEKHLDVLRGRYDAIEIIYNATPEDNQKPIAVVEKPDHNLTYTTKEKVKKNTDGTN